MPRHISFHADAAAIFAIAPLISIAFTPSFFADDFRAPSLRHCPLAITAAAAGCRHAISIRHFAITPPFAFMPGHFAAFAATSFVIAAISAEILLLMIRQRFLAPCALRLPPFRALIAAAMPACMTPLLITPLPLPYAAADAAAASYFIFSPFSRFIFADFHCFERVDISPLIAAFTLRH
jgi:hypothetical protein